MEWTRFTLLHVIGLVISATLAVGVGMCGKHWLGAAGAMTGGAVGLVIGLAVASWWGACSFRAAVRAIERKPTEELWAYVQTGEWGFFHTVSLLNLSVRGEEVRGEFPKIVNMLRSDDMRVRRFGWDALRLVFQEEMEHVEGYEPRETTAACREKSEPLLERFDKAIVDSANRDHPECNRNTD